MVQAMMRLDRCNDGESARIPGPIKAGHQCFGCHRESIHLRHTAKHERSSNADVHWRQGITLQTRSLAFIYIGVDAARRATRRAGQSNQSTLGPPSSSASPRILPSRLGHAPSLEPPRPHT